MILLALIFFLFCILEGTFIGFPLTLLFLVFFALTKRSPLVFLFAFFGGLALDTFYLRHIGFTSLFFLIYIFGILLYERKFEIGSNFFIFISVLVGSFLYFSLFGYSFVLAKTIITVIIAPAASKFILKPKVVKERLW